MDRPNEFARTPDESQYPELWEGFCDQGGVWHKSNGKWELVKDRQ